MVPYFVTCHVNCHTVLHYIDAVQSIGLPGDPCPMCQAEAGLSVLDDMPDYFPCLVTSNEACDGSVGTSILQDWAYDRPLFAMPQPMQFDDPLVQEHCRREIEECWKFIEEQTGEKFDYDCFVKYIERYNELTPLRAREVGRRREQPVLPALRQRAGALTASTTRRPAGATSGRRRISA